MRLNKKYNEAGAKGRNDVIWVEKSERPSTNEPQAFWLYPGLIMIAYISQGKAGNVHNGQLFETQWFANDMVAMRDIESNEIHELTLEFVKHNLRLGFVSPTLAAKAAAWGILNHQTAPSLNPNGASPYGTPSRSILH